MHRSMTAVTLGVCLFFSACTSLTPERGVVDNVFYSTLPKLLIKLNDDFKYLDNLSDSNFIDGRRGTTGHRVTLSESKDVYTFVVNEGEAVRKVLSFNIQYLDGIWRTQLSKKQKDTSLRHGREDIRCVNFTYTIWPVKPSGKAWLAERVIDMGYTMSCGLVKYSYGTVGSDRCLVTVIYYEDIADSGFRCDSWKEKSNLSLAQHEYLTEFNKNSRKSFDVLDYDAHIDEIVVRSAANRFDGIWSGESIGNVAVNRKGVECSERAVIRFKIEGSQISGAAADSKGSTYRISGTVDKAGNITVGAASAGRTFVEFTGTLTQDSGNGRYESIYGCAGEWISVKQ